jgi:hypothetical protein
VAKVAPGDSLPDLALQTLDGAPHGLGGAAVLAIGHGDCQTTRLALPYIDRIHRRCGAPGAVALVLQDEPGDARALAAELGLSLPLLLDREPYAAGARLGLEVVPTLVVMDPAGRVRSVTEGFDRQALEEAAAAAGVRGTLFEAMDRAPRMRPG